jgi:hypothetical protein
MREISTKNESGTTYVIKYTSLPGSRKEEPCIAQALANVPVRTEAETMGLSYNVYLNSPKIYGCKNCKAHLSGNEDIISRVRYVPLLSCIPAFDPFVHSSRLLSSSPYLTIP